MSLGTKISNIVICKESFISDNGTKYKKGATYNLYDLYANHKKVSRETFSNNEFNKHFITLDEAILKTLQTRESMRPLNVGDTSKLFVKSKIKEYLDFQTFGKSMIVYMTLTQTDEVGDFLKIGMFVSGKTSGIDELIEMFQKLSSSVNKMDVYDDELGIYYKLPLSINSVISKLIQA